jgi:hypothetical protein
MSDKKWQAAADFITELENNPDFVKRRDEKQQRNAARAATLENVQRPILDKLKQLGVTGNSIDEIVQRYAPLPPPVIEVLLESLSDMSITGIKESIIRALGAAQEPFDGELLIQCFEKDYSDTLRWPIANTLAEARVNGVSQWLVHAVLNKRYGKSREMLVMALAKTVSPDVALPVLRSVFEELPGHVARAMRDIGTASDANFLERRVEAYKGWEKKELLKTIKAIQKRNKSQDGKG